MRVLLVPVESAQWSRARTWSYSSTFAFADALEAAGADVTILPAIQEFPSLSPRSWLYHAPRLLAGQRFDQAWVWVTYNDYDPVFLAWLTAVAPVRIALVTASMEHTAAEYRESPHLLARRDFVDRQLAAMTHVLAADEHDAPAFAARLRLPAAWLPPAVPASALTAADASLDAPAQLDDRFDALQREMLVAIANARPDEPMRERYVAGLRGARRQLFEQSLASLRGASELVNPPSTLKAYPSSVIEGMAAGVPVISWDVPHRPANRALFQPGRDIRLFDRDDHAALERHVRDLRGAPEAAAAQVRSAREQVRRAHTVEHRVTAMLEWVQGKAESVVAGTFADMPQQAPTGADDRHATLFLPAGYVRRDAPASVPRSPGAIDAAPSDAYPLAAALAAALDCTHVVDLGCAEPAGAARLSGSVRVTAVASPAIVRDYERRCPGVTWTTADPASGERALVLCVSQLERASVPHETASRLAGLMHRAGVGLVVSTARDRRAHPGDTGPPTTADHLQEWTAIEIAALLRASGLDVVVQHDIPAARDRRELTAVATIVCRPSLDAERRTQITAVANATVAAYVTARTQASAYDLLERVAPGEPSTTPVFASLSAPSVHVLTDHATLTPVYGRAPLDEARRWAERLEPLEGAPLVLFGLGLGYHATAAAARADAGPIVVVEPFDRMTSLARGVEATRDALDRGRIAIVRDWPEFAALAVDRRLDLAAARFTEMPVYPRLADDAHATFATLIAGAQQWERAGLTRRAKPFFHAPGMSVVVSTYNRVDAVCQLVRDLGAQRDCGVPVELLLVNDNGDPAVFPAARAAADACGVDLRCFDTQFTGYGLTLARNVGLRFARYDTTVFLDDDLRLSPDLLWHYRQAPTGVRAGRIDCEFDDSVVRRHRPDPRMDLHGGPARVLRPWKAAEDFLWGGNCAVPTELGLALGGFDEAFLGEGEEDTDFGARAVRATHRAVAVPGARVLHEGLDQAARVWYGFAAGARPGKSRALLADVSRGFIVNRGVEYWTGARWSHFALDERAAVAARVDGHVPR